MKTNAAPSRAHRLGTRPEHQQRTQRLQHIEQGIALVSSLLILVIVTLLALSMFRSFGLQEKIGGNTREKQRSLQTAESALQYAEWWLSQGTESTTGITCAAVYNANAVGNMQTCANPLLNPTTLPWTARGDYLPPTMTVATGGGQTAGGDINYVNPPSLYINYLGLDLTGKSLMYQVTAAGYGGSTNGASVVQSIYAITAKSVALDQP